MVLYHNDEVPLGPGVHVWDKTRPTDMLHPRESIALKPGVRPANMTRPVFYTIFAGRGIPAG